MLQNVLLREAYILLLPHYGVDQYILLHGLECLGRHPQVL